MVDQESYTPPPWVFWCADTDCEEDNCTQTAHNGRFLIGTHAGGIHAEVTSGLADTRLMTAAPDMLGALRELVAEADEHPGWEGHPHAFSLGFMMAREALRKALQP